MLFRSERARGASPGRSCSHRNCWSCCLSICAGGTRRTGCSPATSQGSRSISPPSVRSVNNSLRRLESRKASVPMCFATMPRPGLCRQFQSRLVQGPQNTGLLACQPFNMRHSPATVDQVYLGKGHFGSSPSREPYSEPGLQKGIEPLRCSAVFRFHERNRSAADCAAGSRLCADRRAPILCRATTTKTPAKSGSRPNTRHSPGRGIVATMPHAA